ncbi:ABC transporter ATP-binding protein [Sulfitobacter donghicola]|uniref:ABC transporter ATP-binding protein n=1 Tax=Sulfitobacter donghicola DSW-25 = KCTC 12864 = JCM 14565 TaxID=1300350 RepID=A0A073IH12_9RHOB|nr:ABC transporter ATP-binding protein [Sulfitobacter donghicola]KEJ89613.1 ABC transporter ATP-binding protein [Sulfitobacter donghicola DSW-25 = KCTC 12864 = JCM 14565]KIN69452.1 ATPase component protein [Sulfitobacter donghicola DSW-25 = KCTC 12864 = JCM 14565]
MSDLTLKGRSIRLHALTKNWGDATALSDINLSIPAGSFTALLGPSGCGKSTLLRMISGLDTPTSGEVYVDEEAVTSQPPSARDLAMVFQSYALFPHLSVAENIIFGLRTRRTPKAERSRKLEQVAELLELSHLLKRKPSELSGGQQQRAALGRAIIAERSICLMDEPLSNLDAKLRQDMRAELRELQRSLGFTMVYVTHDQAEAMTMADQVVLMNKGRIEQVDAPRALYARPQTPFAGQFIGTPPMNILRAADIPDADVFAPHRAQGCLLGLRPEDLRVIRGGPLNGHVEAIEYFGADALVTCRIGAAALRVRCAGRTEFPLNSPISLGFDLSDLSVFAADSGERVPQDLISEVSFT